MTVRRIIGSHYCSKGKKVGTGSKKSESSRLNLYSLTSHPISATSSSSNAIAPSASPTSSSTLSSSASSSAAIPTQVISDGGFEPALWSAQANGRSSRLSAALGSNDGYAVEGVQYGSIHEGGMITVFARCVLQNMYSLQRAPMPSDSQSDISQIHHLAVQLQQTTSPSRSS
jgi:hypothetical protein